MRRSHVMGAAGSGTTTLGRALAARLGCPHHDTDDYFWLPAGPPFQAQRPVKQRVALLEPLLSEQPGWVLSGSLTRWGGKMVPLFDLVVFLQLDTDSRLGQLRARESARFGARIEPGGDLAAMHAGFLAWAAAYDRAGAGRSSLMVHQSWLADLPLPGVAARERAAGRGAGRRGAGAHGAGRLNSASAFSSSA